MEKKTKKTGTLGNDADCLPLYHLPLAVAICEHLYIKGIQQPEQSIRLVCMSWTVHFFFKTLFKHSSKSFILSFHNKRWDVATHITPFSTMHRPHHILRHQHFLQAVRGDGT